MTTATAEFRFRAGVDENGLGGQLGPLVVTAVLAEVDPSGARLLSRKLPRALSADLDDSKALVSSRNIQLGEAWCRALVEATTASSPATPRELLERVLLTPEEQQRKRCPTSHAAQCWDTSAEHFQAQGEVLERVRRHTATLAKRGVRLLAVRSEVLCTAHLNEKKRAGIHRFQADLHAMEDLLLGLQHRTAAPLLAVCGKVGGIGQYGRFFGPLSNQLHNVLLETRADSRYRFPSLGEVRFVKDADAKDPLVMLASLAGKYVRELFMQRIAAFYPEERELATPDAHPSGYHDPLTARFVSLTQKRRVRLGVVDDCFLRLREETQREETQRDEGQRDEEPRKKTRRDEAQGGTNAGSPQATRRRAPSPKNQSQGSLF